MTILKDSYALLYTFFCINFCVSGINIYSKGIVKYFSF